MKSILLVVMIFMGINASLNAKCSNYIVTTEELNIRDKPGKPSNISGTVKRGDKVCVYDFSGKWGRTNAGWISRKHLSLAGRSYGSTTNNSTAKKQCSTYIVSIVELNIRDKPEKSNNILGTVKKGDRVCVYNFSGKWGRIDEGWISGKYLSPEGSYDTSFIKDISQDNLIIKNFDDSSDYIIENTSDKSCKFIFPNSYAYKNNKTHEHMYTKFLERCRKNGHNKVKIYYKRKLLATYEGKLRAMSFKKVLPVEGVLSFVNGNKYQIEKHHGYATTSRSLEEWLAGIHLISKNIKNSVTPDVFDIKLGINSVPADIQSKNYELLGVGMHVTKTDNTIVLNYDIKPNNFSALTKSKYKLEIEIKTSYEKISGGFVKMVGRRSAYDTVVIELDRENNYTANGAKKLRDFRTYFSSMGVSTVLKDFKTDVKVISLIGE